MGERTVAEESIRTGCPHNCHKYPTPKQGYAAKLATPAKTAEKDGVEAGFAERSASTSVESVTPTSIR